MSMLIRVANITFTLEMYESDLVQHLQMTCWLKAAQRMDPEGVPRALDLL